MGLTVKNKTVFELADDVTNFFSLPIEEAKTTSAYNELKNDIYSLNIDNEEKANILNKISSYNTTKSDKEKNKLKKEIEKFKTDYDL